MAAWGYDDFVGYLKFRLGERSELESATDQSQNLYGVWINSAYRQLTNSDRVWGLALDYCFPELNVESVPATTTDGVQYVSTPTDCLYIQEVYDYTNSKRLDWIPWAEYVGYTNRYDTTAEGEPNKWHRRGEYIYLHPTPDTTGEYIYIYYRKKVPNLSGTDETLIGDEWDEVILTLATIKGLIWLRDWDKVKDLKDEWRDMVTGLVGHPSKEQRAQRANIQPELIYSDQDYYGK